MPDRGKLLAVARVWAERLTEREGVVGVFLYGSLAGDPGQLTEFSDVDLALVLEDDFLPAHFAEHRVFEGVKTDTTLLSASTLRSWLAKPPERLYGGNWVHSLFLKALSHGDPEIILFDPSGLVSRVQKCLPSHSTLIRPDVHRWLADYRTSRLEKARTQPETLRELLDSGRLSAVLTMGAGEKNLVRAAEKSGCPELIELFARWESLLLPAPELLEAVCEAREALAECAIAHFYDRLSVPKETELCGEWPVFWWGNRLHTVERLQAELPLTVLWSRALRERGELLEAQGMLWPCDPADIRKRAQALCDALSEQGYDIENLTKEFLSSPALAGCEAAVEAAEAAWSGVMLSGDASREVLALAEEVLVSLEKLM